MKEKWIKGTQNLFAWGMTVLLFACLIAALAYIVALVLGQPVSVRIHKVISDYVFPPVYYGGILLSVDGLLHLYLKGERLFCLDIPKSSGRKRNN